MHIKPLIRDTGVLRNILLNIRTDVIYVPVRAFLLNTAKGLDSTRRVLQSRIFIDKKALHEVHVMEWFVSQRVLFINKLFRNIKHSFHVREERNHVPVFPSFFHHNSMLARLYPIVTPRLTNIYIFFRKKKKD